MYSKNMRIQLRNKLRPRWYPRWRRQRLRLLRDLLRQLLPFYWNNGYCKKFLRQNFHRMWRGKLRPQQRRRMLRRKYFHLRKSPSHKLRHPVRHFCGKIIFHVVFSRTECFIPPRVHILLKLPIRYSDKTAQRATFQTICKLSIFFEGFLFLRCIS